MQLQNQNTDIVKTRKMSETDQIMANRIKLD